MLPKRRFWKSDERLGTRFRSTFQRGEHSIWATFLWKVVWGFYPKHSFGHLKSSFGNINLLQKIMASHACKCTSLKHWVRNHAAFVRSCGSIPENQHIASYSMLLSFVIILQKLLQKITACQPSTRPRNPRFKDVHTGTKRRLEHLNWMSKRTIGIRGLPAA
jgi:hypothetical protein